MTAPTLPPTAGVDRNRRPIVTTMIIAGGVLLGTVVLAVALGPTRPGAPNALGQLYGNAFFGFVALGVWAVKAPLRWSALGWFWRTFVCVVGAMVIMGTLASIGRGAAGPR